MEEREQDGTTPSSDAAPTTRSDRVNVVSSDLEHIFSAAGPLPPPSEPHESAAFSLPPRRGPPRTRRSPIGPLGAAAAVILIGVAVGILVSRRAPPALPAPTPPTPARALTATVPAVSPPVAPPVAPPAPQPVPAAPAPSTTVAAATPPPAPVTEPVAVPAEAASPAMRQLPPLPPQPAGTSRAANDTDDSRAFAARINRRPPQTHASFGDPCAVLEPPSRAHCLFPVMKEADRRLREAYETAAQAGVPRSILSSYRSEWNGLRRRSASEPYQVIDTYDAMATELRQYASDAYRG